MTTDTKLEFADWLLVRDTVITQMNVVFNEAGEYDSRSIAEALMAQGYIDIDAVIAEQRGEEVDADNYVDDDSESYDHLVKASVLPLEYVSDSLDGEWECRVVRSSATNRWVQLRDGATYRVAAQAVRVNS